MNIRLVEYKEGVVTPVEAEYNPKELDLEFVDLIYSQPLKLVGTVEKSLVTLTFRGELSSRVEHVCGRCLKKIAAPIYAEFEFFYEIEGKESIETLDDLRETLILEHPISFVCEETCKGLCLQCGINLNESRCSCVPPDEKPAEGAFAELKKLWNKKKRGAS